MRLETDGRVTRNGERDSMQPQKFRKGIGEVLASHGFAKIHDGWTRSGADVSTLVGFEKGFGSQWYVSVGFWLQKLGAGPPAKVEQCHMYFRLERLLPHARDVVLAAGDLKCPEQAEAYPKLLALLESDALPRLNDLEAEQGLRDGLMQGRLECGLVTSAARQHLLS
jgi:hypothetical protein